MRPGLRRLRDVFAPFAFFADKKHFPKLPGSLLREQARRQGEPEFPRTGDAVASPETPLSSL
jgi:hypothetical protein